MYKINLKKNYHGSHGIARIGQKHRKNIELNFLIPLPKIIIFDELISNIIE